MDPIVSAIEGLISSRRHDYIVSSGALSVGRADDLSEDGEFYVDILLDSGDTEEKRFSTAFLAADFFERHRKRQEALKP